MLRQLRNLRRYGRLRSNGPTPRQAKPRVLRDYPELEITNMLEFVLAHHAQAHEEFFFVQIGAFDGVTADPVYELVRRFGWRGVLVEPQREAFELLQQNYAGQKGLQFYNVAIAPQDGEMTLFTKRGGMTQAASLERQRVLLPGRRRRQIEARTTPCWTFQTLLRNAQVPPTFDLLQIDAEGLDYAIIRSIDFHQVRPAVIRYEHMVLSEAERNACLELLAGHGYRFLLEDSDTTAYQSAAARRICQAA